VFRGWLSRDIIADEHYCATVIQSHIRAYLATMYVYETLYNVTVIQSLFRRRLAVEEARRRRAAIPVIQNFVHSFKFHHHEFTMHSNATKIQATWRGFITHLTYQFTLVDIIIVQSVFRRWQSLKRYWQMRKEKAAVQIQSIWRAHLCSLRYIQMIIDVLIVQSLIRRWLAKQKYNKLQGRFKRESTALNQQALTPSRGVGISPNRAVVMIQKVWRGKKAQIAFVYDLVSIILSQVRRNSHTKLCVQIIY
jgi:myosin heavy subunit